MRRKALNFRTPDVKAKKEPEKNITKNQPQETVEATSTPRLTYAEQRERDKAKKRAAKKVAEAEAEVARLEAEQKAVEDKLAAGDASAEVLAEHAAATRRLENAMSVWELAVMDQESLND